jgi:predicted methyltransferase
MKKTILLALATAALAAPAIAEDHGHKHDAAHAAMHKAHQERMAKILADPSRAEDAKRDKYRHPAETFEFFRIHPNHVVGEYAPGGEWISRTLGRYMEGSGKFNGLFFSTAYTLDAVPAAEKGTFDRIVVMRMMHNLLRWNIADREIKAMRDLLKPGGMIGIEQHRAKANAPFSYTDGSKGYLREKDVIKFMELNGFEYVGSSKANANPKDPANWPDGVWTLPPALRRFAKERQAAAAGNWRKRPDDAAFPQAALMLTGDG